MKKKIVGLGISMLLFATIFSVAGTMNHVVSDTSPITTEEDWWTMYGHDPEHTRYSTSLAPDTGFLVWSFEIEETYGYVYSSPAIVDGKVYFGADSRKLYCLNAENGTEIWSYTTYGNVDSSPAIYEGKVYVGSSDHFIYCFNALNGSKIWSYQTGDSVSCSPVVFDNKVYIGSYDNNMYCLNALNGSEIWNYSTDGSISISPALSDGKIFFSSGYGDMKLYCLNAENGSKIWDFLPPGFNWYSSPTVVDGKVYFGKHYNVYCLNADNGSEIWNTSTPSASVGSPAFAEGKLYIGCGSEVICYNALNGSEIWSSTPRGAVYRTSPSVADNKVFIGSDDNFIYCLDAENGSTLWSYETGGLVRSSPAVADGKVVVGSLDKKVYCFRENNPPEIPEKPDGSTEGIAGEEICFSTSTTDPEGDQVYYKWHWGIGSGSWEGPYESGEEVTACHTWTEPGTYDVKVKAKDIFEAESDWSPVHTVTIFAPELEIGEITGGLLSATIEIKNIGDVEINDIAVITSAKGGILNSINISAQEIISNLEPGESKEISISPIVGLGPVEIAVTANAEDVEELTKTIDGFIFFIFVIIS